MIELMNNGRMTFKSFIYQLLNRSFFLGVNGGHGQIRTADLTIISRAL